MAVTFYSQNNAEEVLRAVKDARNDELDKLFELKIVGLGDGIETRVSTIRVRETRDQQFLTNGRSVVHCKNTYDRQIDVYLPPEGEQSITPAEILIEEDDIPTHGL